MARDRKNRIILGGNTDDYAEQIGRAIISRIERQKNLEKDYGLRQGVKWAVNEMHIERPNWEDKDPSLLCLGAGSEIQSQRADFIITDDIATRRNSRTEAQRKSISSYFFTDLASRLDKTNRIFGKGKTFVFGHRVDSNDLYIENLGRKKWSYVEDRAIIDDTEARILCPEGQTYDDLCEMRSRDPFGFELMYQQRSAAMGKFVTRTAMESCRVPNLRFLQSMTPDNRSQYRFTWLSLDPAFTVTKHSSYAVFNLWGLTHEGKRRLLWAFRDRLTSESLLQIMEMKFRLFMPDHFFIESNQGQVLLLPFMRKRFPDHSSKFKGVYTTNNNGNLDNEIAKLFDLYSTEKPIVEIPYAGPTEQAYAHTMLEEYCGYPDHPRRDTLMSEYVGLKGLGMLKDEMRRGYVPSRGIMGEVARKFKQRFIYR